MVVVALRGRLAFVDASVDEGGEEGDAWAPLNGRHMFSVGVAVRTQARGESGGERGTRDIGSPESIAVPGITGDHS